jgi:hypothetical protein
VYSTDRSVYLNDGESFTINTECSLENASYEWYKDDEKILGADYKSYTIENASNADTGLYSVKITSESGTQRTVDICRVIDVIGRNLQGDINKDGITDYKDAELLADYLIGRSIGNKNYSYDVNSDNVVDSFDLVFLRSRI